MRNLLIFLLLPLTLGLGLAHGAVYTVNVGQTIQSAIDSASSGDEIIVNGAFFDEDLVIDGKSLTLRRQSLISEIKSISFTNASGTSILEGFKVRQDLNATGSDVHISNVDFGGDLNASNSSLRVAYCDVIGFVLVSQGDLTITNSDIHQSVTVNQGSLKLTKSTVDKDVSINHSTNSFGSPTRTVIAQTTITEKLTSNAPNSLVSYNTIRHSIFTGNATIVGNIINGRNIASIGIDLNGTNSVAKIYNNYIQNFVGGIGDNSHIGIAVRNQVQAEIINNLIKKCISSSGNGPCGMGIYIESTGRCSVISNIIYECYGHGNPTLGNRLIWAPAWGVLVQYNLLYGSNQVGGGVIDKDSIYQPYKINNDGTLKPDSPAINAGPPDPQYNDRDGSRNDIGMFGGHNYIPDGRTTDKPIVLGLDVAPIAVPVGGTVTIESTGATVK